MFCNNRKVSDSSVGEKCSTVVKKSIYDATMNLNNFI